MILQNAPAWSSTAYHNKKQIEISSEDLTGRWYVLFFYPLDFSMICPTELREFQRLNKSFAAEETTIIGCSTDSFYSHRAWFAETPTFYKPITYPILADTSHAVTKAFGMLNAAKGTAFRATVIVDNTGVVRSLAVNDDSVGRNPSDVLRTLQALRSGGLCGVNWTQGDGFIRA